MSELVVTTNNFVTISRLPVLEDNYIFLIRENAGNRAIAVDPALAEPVTASLARSNHRLTGILNTHHHADHTGANCQLAKDFPGLSIFGPYHDSARIPCLTHGVREGESLELLGIKFTVIETPGHTRGHIVYLMSCNLEAHYTDVFAGDTLFGGGCGKLFEGTPQQMLTSLSKIRTLPDTTRIWCAHEYTEKNYRVACELEPHNTALHEHLSTIKNQRKQGLATVPLLLGEEKRYNPFLRWDDPQLAAATKTTDPLATFTAVRHFRDRF